MAILWLALLTVPVLVWALRYYRRAQRVLEQAHARDTIMSLAVDQGPMAVAITDVDGALVYGNPAFCHRTGYTLLEIIGENPRILKSGLMGEEFYEELWATILDGKIWEGELCNKDKQGNIYWEHANIGPIRDDLGRTTHYVKVAEDITEKKNLIASRIESDRRFQFVFEQVSLGMAIVDLDGRWKEVNRALCDFLGYGERELVGSHFLEFTVEEDRDQEQGWKEALLKGPQPPPVIEKRYRHKAGHIVWAEVSASPIWSRQDRAEFFICVINDVTRRKGAEEEAARDREELAHVLRIHTLQQMTSELSHEMDQPLCAILSAAQAAVRLRERLDGEAPELDRALGMIVGQAERAGAVVRRIKDFSRRQEPQLRPVDLFTILGEAGALLEPEIRRLKITILLDTDIPGDCPVKAERVQLQQVVINLCRNAAEAMHAAGHEQPEIRVLVEQDEDWVHVRVRDNGERIPEDLRESIFTPFYTTRAEGLGLGLPLCRSIIDAHGGELSLDAEPGTGNSFHFTLPRIT